MSDREDCKTVYVAHPASGLARSNYPTVCEVSNSKIVRSLPFRIPEDVRLYEIKTTKSRRLPPIAKRSADAAGIRVEAPRALARTP